MAKFNTRAICLALLSTMLLCGCLAVASHPFHITLFAVVGVYGGFCTALLAIPISVGLGIYEWRRPERKIEWPLLLFWVSTMPAILWLSIRAAIGAGD